MNRAEFDAGCVVGAPIKDFQQYRPDFYESPIEDRLAWRLSKVLAPGVALLPQIKAATAYGEFRPDLLLHTPGQNTVLECDGREFHQDSHRDLARDIALLSTGLVDRILRFQGGDLYAQLPDIIQVISLFHPAAFGHRGRVLARRAAAPEMLEITATALLHEQIPLIGGSSNEQRTRHTTIRIHAFGSASLKTPAALALVEGMKNRSFASFTQAVESTRHIH